MTKALPEVGGIEAQSEQASFLNNLKGNSSIEAANREIPLSLEKTSGSPYNYQSILSAHRMQRIIGTLNGIFNE